MAGTRKRKHVSIQEDIAPLQQDMRSFAKVRKVQASDSVTKKGTVQKRQQTPPPNPSQTSMPTKRKRGREPTEEEAAHTDAASAATTNKRAKMLDHTSPHDTPSKKAAALFNRLDLDSKIKPIPFALDTSTPAYDTPPTSPDSSEAALPDLPEELDDLIQLQTAFLSAVSLYYAHNGTSSPADAETLLPMVTKHWRKRTVSLDDLRMLLAVTSEEEGGFALQDYGNGGVRLTKQLPRGRAANHTASYVDEVYLKSRFRSALMKRYNKWLALNPQDDSDYVALFLEQLPRIEISEHESVKAAAPVFARGQQRLADLKASQAAASTGSTGQSQPTGDTQPSPVPAQSRGTNLLDRILAKQALSASLPAGPTKDQVERKAALHRVESVARVLDLLATGRPRCSFSLHAVVQQLQQSLRNPISKEEVEKCLNVMKQEITPGFVNTVRNGNVVCVVITKGGRLGLDEIRRRVEDALA